MKFVKFLMNKMIDVKIKILQNNRLKIQKSNIKKTLIKIMFKNKFKLI